MLFAQLTEWFENGLLLERQATPAWAEKIRVVNLWTFSPTKLKLFQMV